MEILKRIFRYCSRYRRKMIAACIFLILYIAVNLITPTISGIIVDDVIKGGKREMLSVLLLILLVGSVLKSAAMYFRGILFESFSQDCLYDLRNDMYTHLQQLPFSFYDNNRIGELMSRMTGDLEGVRVFLASGIPVLMENGVYFFGTAVILFIQNAKLAVATLLVTPSIAYCAYRFNQVVRPVFSEIREQQATLNTVTQENITGVRMVKAFAREDYETGKFEKENRRNRVLNIKSSRIWGKYFPAMDFISGICLILLIWFGGRMVGRGEISIGTVVTFNGYLWMLIMPMRMLGWIINMMAQAITSGQRIFDVLDTGTTIREPESPYDPEEFRGDVSFQDVTFRYREQPVLLHVNFQAPAGSTIAIMGATGAGKTSVINLIERFYDRSSGSIRIDGVEIQDWSIRRLRSEIGIVLQDTFLFSDTIEGNILYGKPDATREEVIQAAKMADAHDFISETPQGYDTIVGERGTGLSGGQKQRIAIARALIKDPKILIMDDCTSAVDMDTEYKIQKALKEVQKDRTTFIIAHRISSVKNADEILILENGRIVERGNHEQLMNRKGRYYEMVRQQYHDLDKLEEFRAGWHASDPMEADRKGKVI
ncbi:ABC transporter ATP-binding protein [Eubacteriales bacterium mix99]